jgi:transcriptional regulator with XRE-family HTH domain
MKTPVQQALVDLRRRLGITQLELALKLGLTPVTPARWESSHLPHGHRLDQLARFAEEHEAPDLARIFRTALQREEQLKLQYDNLLRTSDETVDFEAAIRDAWEVSGYPRVAHRWNRIVDDLIFILRQKIREEPTRSQHVKDLVQRLLRYRKGTTKSRANENEQFGDSRRQISPSKGKPAK